MQEIGNRGPRLGPWDKVFRFFSSRPAVFLGWKSCCKQEDCRYIHIYTGHLNRGKGKTTQIYGIYKLNGSMVQIVDRVI